MADVKWIKLDVGIFEDEKIKIVLSMPEGKNLVVIWLKLLCLAGRLNNSGVLMVNKTIPYTAEMLSAVFDESESIMRLAIDTFQRLGMIEQFNGALLLPNWEKHQSEDRLKEIQNKNAARVARHRERQRLQAGNVTDTLQKRLCNAVEQEQEQEQKIYKNDNDNENDDSSPNRARIVNESSEPNKIKGMRHKYGEYQNVLLTDGDLEKLKAEIPGWESMIDRLSGYMKSTGKVYKDHLATMRNWARRERPDGRHDAGKADSDGPDRRAGTVTLDNGITVTRL